MTEQRYPDADAKGDEANLCAIRCRDLNNVPKGKIETQRFVTRFPLMSRVFRGIVGKLRAL